MSRNRILMLMGLLFMAASGCMREYDDLRIIAVRNASAIWIMNADGSDQQELTSTSADGICTDASWSADGMIIAYVQNSVNLCIMNADGTGKRLLYTCSTGCINPTFYPDGKKLAFGDGSGLYEYNLETGAVSLLHSLGGVITFISIGSDGSISVLNLAGWDVYRPGTGWGHYSASSNWCVAWSADAGAIAYVYTGGPGSLYVVSADTSALDGSGTSIAAAAATSGVTWTPSGDYIYYSYNGIWRIRPDGSGGECVVADSSFSAPQILGKTR